MNKLLIVLYIALVAFYIVGCETTKPNPEGKLIGTLSVYRTPSGSMSVVNDQDGNKMIFEWHLGRVLTPKKVEPND